MKSFLVSIVCCLLCLPTSKSVDLSTSDGVIVVGPVRFWANPQKAWSEYKKLVQKQDYQLPDMLEGGAEYVVNISFVSFDHKVTSEEVVQKMKDRGYRPATLDEFIEIRHDVTSKLVGSKFPVLGSKIVIEGVRSSALVFWKEIDHGVIQIDSRVKMIDKSAKVPWRQVWEVVDPHTIFPAVPIDNKKK